MPDRVSGAMWAVLAAGWLASASAFTWMKIRARRGDRVRHVDARREWLGTTAGRRFTLAFDAVWGVCLWSALVPILAGASPAVTIYWLLAIVPVAYAGVWVILGVLVCMWLAGWRPQASRSDGSH